MQGVTVTRYRWPLIGYTAGSMARLRLEERTAKMMERAYATQTAAVDQRPTAEVLRLVREEDDAGS